MRIPMQGRIGSLNAAVAGSVLLFEAVAQRDPAGTRSTVAATAPPFETASASAAAETTEPGDDASADDAPAEHETAADPAADAPAADAPSEHEPAPEPEAIATEPPDEPAAELTDQVPAPGDEDLLPGGPAPADPPPTRKPRAPRTPRA
jgi:hypothetical protein